MAFDFKKSLIKVQGGRSYLPVSARLIWFREEHSDWGIETEPIELNHEKQFAVFRARIYNAEGKLMAMGTKKEDVKGFGDYIEKAETGAVGRALALCGYGTQFSPELDEVGGDRVVDTPYPMAGDRYGSGSRDNYGGDADGSRFGGARPAAAQDASLAGRLSDEQDERRDASKRHNLTVHTAPDGASSDDESSVTVVPPSSAQVGGAAACVGCGRSLTKAQQDLSTRNYGEALCPGCQKERARPAAAA